MRRWREILVTVAIIGGLAAYWIGSEVHYARSISPKGVSTMRDFFERFGEPPRIRMVQRDGQSYYEFTGLLPSSWSGAVPSAAPAYVFDEQGQFTAWCRDPGDTPSYRRTWPLQSTNQIEVGVVRQKFGL
jgi:hypothetical protein